MLLDRNLRRLGVALVFAALSGVGCGSSAPPPAPVAPTSAPDEPPPPPDFGTIDVYCEPPTPILIDGKPVGTSPLKQVKVTPGSHDVTFADEASGNRTMSVTVEPGENRSVISDRPKSSQDATDTKPAPKKKP